MFDVLTKAEMMELITKLEVNFLGFQMQSDFGNLLKVDYYY